jgi:hypothetical protein
LQTRLVRYLSPSDGAGKTISNKKDISVKKVAANSKAIAVMLSPKFRVVETITSGPNRASCEDSDVFCKSPIALRDVRLAIGKQPKHEH